MTKWRDAGLEPVNATADQAPGFVWRLQDDAGDATAIRAFERDADGTAGVIVNLSVWLDLDPLLAFVYADAHRAVLRRRREWFVPIREAYTACWWVPSGHRPSTLEAEDRVRQLRANGPTAHAFGLREHFPPPDTRRVAVRTSGSKDTFPGS